MAVETDQQYLISYIRTALEQIALLNYPYAQDSPKVLAEWPVKAGILLLYFLIFEY